MYIPDNVLTNIKLGANEKLLYGLIVTYQEEGVCYKSNVFFASKLNVSLRSVQIYINHLRDQGLIGIVNYEKSKNALAIINKNDWTKSDNAIENTVSKILNSQSGEKFCASSEEYFAPGEKSFANDTNFRGNDGNLISLGLVSQQNININNNRACVRARENVDKPTIFASYEILNGVVKAPTHTPQERAKFGFLFSNVYAKYKYMPGVLSVVDEIVDTLVEAVMQSNLSLGLTFRGLHFDKLNPIADVLLNITDKELFRIVESVANKLEFLKNRPSYILSAIINAGTKINSAKVYELVGQGAPWTSWTPRNKYLSQVVLSAQNYYQKQQIMSELHAEYEKQALKG